MSARRTAAWRIGLDAPPATVRRHRGNHVFALYFARQPLVAVAIGGMGLTGGAGFVLGTLMGNLIEGLIRTYITFHGALSSRWTKIVMGMLLLPFILLRWRPTFLGERRATAVRP